MYNRFNVQSSGKPRLSFRGDRPLGGYFLLSTWQCVVKHWMLSVTKSFFTNGFGPFWSIKSNNDYFLVMCVPKWLNRNRVPLFTEEGTFPLSSQSFRWLLPLSWSPFSEDKFPAILFGMPRIFMIIATWSFGSLAVMSVCETLVVFRGGRESSTLSQGGSCLPHAPVPWCSLSVKGKHWLQWHNCIIRGSVVWGVRDES